MNALFKLLALTLALLLLSACGSSSDDDDDIACSVVDISPDGMLDGTLSSSDCEVRDLLDGTNDDSFADQYRVTLAAPATLTITLRSSEIDAFLAILNTGSSCAGGCSQALILALDDDSGGGVNGLDAQIVIGLGAGSYIIFANSFSREIGAYTIETSTI